MGTQMVRGRKNPREHAAYKLQFPVKEDTVPDSQVTMFRGTEHGLETKSVRFCSLNSSSVFGKTGYVLINLLQTVPDKKLLTNHHLVLTASLPGVREGLETSKGV